MIFMALLGLWLKSKHFDGRYRGLITLVAVLSSRTVKRLLLCVWRQHPKNHRLVVFQTYLCDAMGDGIADKAIEKLSKFEMADTKRGYI
jgi:hypothetical protein